LCHCYRSWCVVQIFAFKLVRGNKTLYIIPLSCSHAIPQSLPMSLQTNWRR
jgi:hypothetical protein